VIAGLLTANLASVLAARSLLAAVRTGTPSIDTLLFLLLRLLFISAFVLAAGITGLLTPSGAGIAGAAALAILIGGGAGRGVLRTVPRPEIAPWAGVVVGAIVLRFAVQAWLFVPATGDALSYHLPKIGEWIRAGSFTRELGLDTHASLPAGFELIETWWVVFLHHDVLIELAGAEFLLVSFAAVRALAETMGLSPRPAKIAGLLYILTPGLHLQATSCLNDHAVAALVAATFALVAVRAPVATVLLALGLGAGIKGTYLFALAGPTLLIWLRRKDRVLQAPHPRVSIAVAGLSLLVGAAWAARNTWVYGNPIHPLGADGLVDASGHRWLQSGPELSSLAENLSMLLNRRLDDRGALGALLANVAGWGPAAFSVGLLGAIEGILTDATFRRFAASFGLSTATVSLMTLPDPWSARFLLFVPALLVVAAVRIATGSRPLSWLLGACGVFLALSTCWPAELPAARRRPLLASGWRDRSSAPPELAALSDPVVGCFAENEGESYLLYRPDFSRDVAYLRPTSSEDLVAQARRKGLRHLYARPSSAAAKSLLEDCVRTGGLVPVGGRIYRVAD
jgi:hypothetical protein